MSSNLRIRLKFKEKDPNGNKAQLYLVDIKNIQTVNDLLTSVRDKFYAGLNVEINLLIDEFVLPVDERLDIVRDNDVILVECISPNSKNSGNKEVKSQKPKPVKVEKSKDDCDSDTEIDQILPAKKRYEYSRGKEFYKPLSSSTPHVYVKKIPDLIKFKTLQLPPSSDMQKLDEAFIVDLIKNKNEKKSEPQETLTKVKNKHVAFDMSFFADCLPKELLVKKENEVNFEEQMKYERCESLTSIPKINDIIAFKIMRISANYLTEVSEFKAGKVTNTDLNTQMLCLEMLRDDIIKEFCRPNVITTTKKLYVDWNTLVDPKLVLRNRDNLKSTELTATSSVDAVHAFDTGAAETPREMKETANETLHIVSQSIDSKNSLIQNEVNKIADEALNTASVKNDATDASAKIEEIPAGVSIDMEENEKSNEMIEIMEMEVAEHINFV